VRIPFCLLFLPLLCSGVLAQESVPLGGSVSGNVLSVESSRALAGVSVSLKPYTDSALARMTVSDEDGNFLFGDLDSGWYFLRLTYSGHQALKIDSIRLQAARPVILLADLRMTTQVTGLETIVVHAVRPVLENKDGNIVFNATESPLSAGSSASELLRTIPMVTQDPDGRVTVRGREPRILVDDKPVSMNAQQMQDFLESMPGNMIERIEVMTNPPAQYANEPGGVINIVTRKGRAGWAGKVSVTAGSRGEAAASANMSVRRKGFTMQLNASYGSNIYNGNGYSVRTNSYPDSVNRLLTENEFVNRSQRPNLRLNMEYDMDERNAIGFTMQMNGNDQRNINGIGYANENRDGEVYRRSDRRILKEGSDLNPSLNFNYTHKGRIKGEQFRLTGGMSGTDGRSLKDFYQVFYDGMKNPTGRDSAQEQHETNVQRGLMLRVGYDRPLKPDRTILSASAAFDADRNQVVIDSYDKDPGGSDLVFIPLLSNAFNFTQTVYTYGLSGKQRLGDRCWLTAGLNMEATGIHFDFERIGQEVRNDYTNALPFANFNKNWQGKASLSVVYRRTIRRPGIRELNPAIDYTDPYNLRFGNPALRPTLAHNFDVVVGRTLDNWQMNAGLGYNRVEDIFAVVRTLGQNGRTAITWQNISGRREFEANAWVNHNLGRNLKVNANAGYSYNLYSSYDIEVNKFRNGGSVNARIQFTYAQATLWNITGNLQFNRYANPQGTVRSNLNMVLGGQYRFLDKKLTVSVQAVDPFVQQKYRTVTEGVNFTTESMSMTQTRNFRITLSYALSNTGRIGKKNGIKTEAKKGKAKGNA
jgi:outer membrane receptor protein involved in Fe transport